MVRENLIYFILLLLPLLSYAHIRSELATAPKGFSGQFTSIEKTINKQINELEEIDLINFLDLRSWEGQKVKKITIVAKCDGALCSNAYVTSHQFSISPVRELSSQGSKIEFRFNKDVLINDELSDLSLVLQGNSYISKITAELQGPHILESWYF